uniref:Uncharacterized protein n=1 Tax=Timema monikensis TaxID=170555 RepID=A0A7R9HMQ1_9NEOP|nr:unnamed protein product [Timema monikensis]
MHGIDRKVHARRALVHLMVVESRYLSDFHPTALASVVLIGDVIDFKGERRGRAANVRGYISQWKTDKFNSTMGSWGCILLSMVWKYLFWISSTVLPLTATSIFSSKALQKTYRHHIRCLGDLPRVIHEGVRVEGLATDSTALHRTQIYVSPVEEKINYPPQSNI